jgi:hypothetical protein
MIRGREPMTIAELKRHMDRCFVTKRGLKRALQRHPTKDDLTREFQKYATKDELNDLRRTVLAMHHEMRAGFDEMRLGIGQLRDDLLYIVDNHERRLNDLDAMHRV